VLPRSVSLVAVRDAALSFRADHAQASAAQRDWALWKSLQWGSPAVFLPDRDNI
jgi:hypothetical protein